MNKAFAPLHLKRKFGDPKRFTELRHHFKASPTAQALIDYAESHEIKLVDNTRTLQTIGWGGAYNHAARQIEYSHFHPTYNIFHEMRHAQQMAAIDAIDPDLHRDGKHHDLRRAFMAVALLETDACFYQEKVVDEMQGKEGPQDPLLYFHLFLKSYASHWLADTASDDFVKKSLFRDVTNEQWRQNLQKLERQYDCQLMQHGNKILPAFDTSTKARNVDRDYIERYTDVVCRNEAGKNYLLDGSRRAPDVVIDKLWEAIFTKDRQLAIRLSKLKEQQYQTLTKFQLALTTLSHSPFICV